jgi:hypothetical protein
VRAFHADTVVVDELRRTDVWFRNRVKAGQLGCIEKGSQRRVYGSPPMQVVATRDAR